MKQAQEKQKVPYSTFDLSQVDVKDRFSLWRKSMSMMVMPDMPDKSMRESFNAQISSYRFSSVLFSHNSVKKQNVNRSSGMIAKESGFNNIRNYRTGRNSNIIPLRQDFIKLNSHIFFKTICYFTPCFKSFIEDARKYF